MLSISAVSAADANGDDDIIASNVDEEPPSESSYDISMDNLTASNQDDYVLTSSDLTMYEKDGSDFNVTLKKGTSPVKGASVIFSVNGKNYTRTTDGLGIALIHFGFKAGNYTVTTYYGQLSNSNKLVILPVIIANDLNKFQGGAGSFTAKFLDSNGKALANADITFNYNGKNYTRKTNSNGVASLGIGSKAGSYVITSIHPNGAKVSNNILVVDAIKANDLNKFQGDVGSFTAEFFNVNGNHLTGTNIVFNFNGKNYTRKTNSNGVASLGIGAKAGSYVMTVYHPSGIQISRNILVVDAIKANDLNKFQGGVGSFTAKFFNSNGKVLANADIVFNFNGKNYTRKTNSNGVASLGIGAKAGSYVMTVYHPSGIQISRNILVVDAIKADDLTMYHGSGESFTAKFFNSDGSPLANADVIFSVHGRNYTKKTDSTGAASLPIGLNVGSYVITVYHPSGIQISRNILVLSTVQANDLNMFHGSGESFTAKFFNTDGSPLANSDIIFSVHGMNYTKETNSKGVASLPIGLNAGSYVITSIHPNGVKVSNNILVVDAIKANDLIKFKGTDGSFTAEFFNINGNHLTGADIVFNVNGKNYTRKTNSNGVASLGIGLKAGSYVMTVYHPSGIQISRNILVVDAIKANDLTMYHGSGKSFTAEFFNIDGSPLANANIIFSVNGRNYTKKTDSAGVAELPIGLNVGSYVITAIHPAGIELSKKIIVKSTVVASDLTKHYSSSKHFTATFYSKNGSVLANKNVKFYAKGTYYTATTNSNGKATLEIISTPSKFDVTSINSETGDQVTNTVEILPTVIASSMTVYEGVTSKFKVTLYNGESLAGNTNMKIYIDGTKKTVKTNANGVATLSFNLKEGTHVFKSVDPFTGYSVNTNVYVKAAPIKADDMRVKGNTTSTFKATLYKDNGELAASTNMQITINGVTKTVKTNSKGVASYSFNLPEGIYSAVCKDLATGYTITKTITVGSITYNQYGVSEDGMTILAIGRPSASGEESTYGYYFYRVELERTCPYCGSHELYWSIFWAGDETTNYGYFPVTGNGEGSSAEGIILCANCDCDWSIFGHEHKTSNQNNLNVVTSPVKTTKADAYALLDGNYVLA